MFLKDSDLKAYVAGVLQKAEADLPAYWDALVGPANTAAYWEIVGRLLPRGFTQSQVNAWDRGAEFQRGLGLWFALSAGAALAEYDSKFLDRFDRREELNSVLVTTGGNYVAPQQSTEPISSGGMNTGGDLFSFDPNDRGRGQPTQF